MLEISVEELKRKLDAGEAVHLLDIREWHELQLCHLAGAEYIPMMDLFAGLRDTAAPPEAEIVVYCHTGQRSLEAARLLRSRGYSRASSLAGGIDAWAERIDPAMKRY